MKKKLCVASFLTKQDSNGNSLILLGKRGKEPNYGLFVLPAGEVEGEKTLEEDL